MWLHNRKVPLGYTLSMWMQLTLSSRRVLFSTDRAVCSLRNFREHVLSRKTGAGNPLRGEGQTGIKSEGWSSFPPFAGNKGRSAPIKEPGSGQASTSEGAIWLGSNNS